MAILIKWLLKELEIFGVVLSDGKIQRSMLLPYGKGFM